MGAEHRLLRGAMKGALRVLYPPQCLACGTGVSDEGALCPECWADTDFVAGLFCEKCAAPLPAGDDQDAGLSGATNLCDDCLTLVRPWQRAAAAMVYGGAARRMTLALKHGDRPDLAPPLAVWLHRAAQPLICPGMVVVPVPVHWRRLLKRKYNQSELLSRRLAQLAQLTHLPDALQRSRHTASQDHKGVADRFANIQDAIVINPSRIAQLQGHPVLLVDDVMTSGATLSASAQALRDHGSGPVSVVVLARAVKRD